MNGMGHKPDALRSGVHVRRSWWGLSLGATVLGAMLALSGPASAGSDNSSNTYAGDANGIVIPTGTLLAIQYFGVRESDTYVTTNDNIFAKLGAGKEIDSEFELFTSITRFVYFTSLFNHPLALEAAFTGVEVNEANIGNEPVHNPATGLGPQSVQDGFLDPVFFLSYGLIAAPKDERFLVLTNYFYLPFGRYDKFANVNVAAPEQFTWVPQVALAEGLGKYGLKNFWLDVIANASLHTDGNAPLAIRGVGQFDELDQDNSYDLKVFLRYEFMQSGHIAVGIEKSWGGDQIAKGGELGALLGATSLGKDDFLKGHLQISYPLTPDIHIATDITHDFQREGGFDEDITAEIRLVKFFLPSTPLSSTPLK